jgi:hypothetical protein
MTFCELCELPLEHCTHGAKAAGAERVAAAKVIEVSPTGTAHFPGCSHKGADPDFSKWGEIEGDGIWQRLANKELVPITSGGRKLTAKRRCDHCVEHGPWL